MFEAWLSRRSKCRSRQFLRKSKLFRLRHRVWTASSNFKCNAEPAKGSAAIQTGLKFNPSLPSTPTSQKESSCFLEPAFWLDTWRFSSSRLLCSVFVHWDWSGKSISETDLNFSFLVQLVPAKSIKIGTAGTKIKWTQATFQVLWAHWPNL